MSGIVKNVADVVALIVLFGFSIFVHELAHFLVALRCGMVAEVFSIGFGPALWKRKIRGVTYKIGCIPFGGYVSIPQIDPSGMARLQGSSESEPGGEPRAELPAVSPWKRILVSVAGAGANILLAIVLAWIIYWSPQPPAEGTGPEARIGHVDTNSAAYEAGMRAGDLIKGVNGKKVLSWYDFSVECTLMPEATGTIAVVVQSGDQTHTLMVPYVEGDMGLRGVEGLDKQSTCVITDVVPGGSAAEAGILAGDAVSQIDGLPVHGSQHFIDLVSERGGKTIPLVVERKGARLTLMVTPKYSETHKRALIGVQIGSLGGVSFPWMEYRNPWDQIRSDASMIGRVLKALVTPNEARQASNGLGGPLMIVATLWVSIKVSFLNALGFLRFLNVNLAILNLLPIPVVDGGHVVFALWEGITRRRVNPRFINILVNGFAILLIGVFILLTLRDVKRLNQFFGFARNRGEAAASNAVPAAATASNAVPDPASTTPAPVVPEPGASVP